jgi:hypothetical protein
VQPPGLSEQNAARRRGTRRDIATRATGGLLMTFVWFVIWFIANNVGAHEPLVLDPVNGWVGTLILAVALDLGGAHATRTRS